jgi:hypothetical protein
VRFASLASSFPVLHIFTHSPVPTSIIPTTDTQETDATAIHAGLADELDLGEVDVPDREELGHGKRQKVANKNYKEFFIS